VCKAGSYQAVGQAGRAGLGQVSGQAVRRAEQGQEREGWFRAAKDTPRRVEQAVADVQCRVGRARAYHYLNYVTLSRSIFVSFKRILEIVT